MSEPAITVPELVVITIVGRLLAYLIVTADERRLSPERLERAWPPASKGAAILQFGELTVPLHFLRTRRNFVGLLLAIAAMYVVLKFEELALMLVGGPFPGLF